MLRNSPPRAFSLVEVLAALAVLLFLALGAYAQFLAAGSQGRRQLTRIQARYLAQQELEQLRTAPFTRLKAWTPAPAAFYPDHPNFVCQDQVATRPGDDLLELTVRVGWEMPLGGPFDPARSVTVKGLRAP